MQIAKSEKSTWYAYSFLSQHKKAANNNILMYFLHCQMLARITVFCVTTADVSYMYLLATILMIVETTCSDEPNSYNRLQVFGGFFGATPGVYTVIDHWDNHRCHTNMHLQQEVSILQTTAPQRSTSTYCRPCWRTTRKEPSR